MSDVRPYTLTLAGTYPNKTLKIQDNRDSDHPYITIEQREVGNLTYRFIEATSDAANSSRKNPFPKMFKTYDSSTAAITDTNYTVTSVTQMIFNLTNGKEYVLELQHTNDSNQNGGEMSDIQNFQAAWVA